MFHLLIFLALFSTSESGCPSMCECSDSSVLCISKNLESIPSLESLTNNPVIIDLSGNKINMIDIDDLSFEKSGRVKEIYLNNTELLDIDSEAFDEVENLQELYLGENLLNSIPEDLIEDLQNMVLLDLSNNHFSGDMPRIRSQSLEVLALANSKITNVPIDSLNFLPNLKMLLLQQNNLKSISPAVFEGVTKGSLFVRLSYNAWECSCENIELFEFLAENNLVDTSEPYQCVTKTGEYVNVYSKTTMDGLKTRCSEIRLKSHAVNEVSAYKENRLLVESEEQPKTENNIVLKSNDKSYSLIKEQNNFEKNETLEGKSEEHTNATNRITGTEKKPSKQLTLDDFFEEVPSKRQNDEETIMARNRGSPWGVKIIYDLNIADFIIILCSFIIGLLFGFCINQYASSARYRKLETSDSRTKLILP